MLETKGLHGESKTRLYNIWIDMKRRCYNPNKQFYYCYGGKGVEVCDEWKDDYLAFKEWALANGYVSVVPVQVDLTAYKQMELLKKIL